MTRRGLAPSREQARQLIHEGRVLVANAPAPKPARLVAPGEPIRVLGPPARFVGRGGDKLQGALDRFGIDVRGARALDAGSSTGGFTDALLQAGAATVVAVDVGRNQLHERLRSDPRVDSREQTDIRDVGVESLGGPVDVVVADLSFISVQQLLSHLVGLTDPDGQLVVLVKPQFEAGRAEVSRGRGVIRDPEVWRRVLVDVDGAVDRAGAAIMEAMTSPLRGADGNVEFLLHLRPGRRDRPWALDVDALLAEVAARQKETTEVVTAGLVLHGERDAAVEVAGDIARWLLDRDHEVCLPADDATRVGLDELAVDEADFADALDVAISLGGDGTMLRAVELVAASGIPVIGINIGQLGYLTEVDPEGARMAVKRYLSGAYDIEERMLLAVHIDGSDPAEIVALNEAVIEKTPMGHTVRLAVSVDGEFFTTYAADGLIVATPTGSTAYSFSARGPIVAPMHRCLVLTPVSPHMLFDRTLVLDPHSTLRLEVVGHRPATVSVDGRNLATLEPGQALSCTSSPRTARLVTFGHHDFLGILKTKFGLSDR